MSVPNSLSPAIWKFVCEALPQINGFNLKALKPDEQGYYDVVLAELGIPTRAGSTYNPKPFMTQMMNPNNAFNISLREGYLFGHADHPIIKTKEDMVLITDIRNENASHHIKSVYSGRVIPASESGQPNDAYLIMGKIKPYGKWKKELTESLEDPNINTSFSLRALVNQYVSRTDGKVYRDVRILVTFDWVTAPGYMHACKRYAPAQESWDMDITAEELRSLNTSFGSGMESLIMDELQNAICGEPQSVLHVDTVFQREQGSNILTDLHGTRRSLTHQFLSKRR